MFIWKTMDGRLLRLEEMSDEHLKNAHRYTLRKLGETVKAAGKLAAEIRRRKDSDAK